MIHKQLYRFTILYALGLLLAVSLAACAPGQPATTTQNADDAITAESAVDTQSTSENTAEAAGADAAGAEETSEEIQRPEGWSEESHSNDADPNYEVVFPQDKVNEITITIAPEDWEAMQADMIDLFGEPGTGGQNPGGFGAPNGERPQRPEGDPAGERPAELGVRGGDMTPENPMWVPATIEFEDDVWTNVGVRYKGNSSLTSSWRSGTGKLPFKFDFDEFEDDYPEIDNQRFYGFKQLSLANGFADPSFLRDAATYDILDEAGLPAAETAFYEVTLDYGEGPVNLGLYTVIEVIDDTVVDRYFGDDDGNIYEGDGPAVSLAEGTFDQIEESFQKENNEDEADWSDIEALYEVLHSTQRTDDPAAWRASLEEIFDVDAFLEWLAISAVIQHWDTYGAMTHNFYLYHDEESGQLSWISWDHNQAMSTDGGAGGPGGIGGRFNGGPGAAPDAEVEAGGDAAPNPVGGRGPGNRSVSLDKAEVGEEWPLIRYLLDDPVYYDAYVNYIAETIEGPFNPDTMAERYQQMADLIEPYAVAEEGQETFDAAVQQLIDHAYERAEAVNAFLSGQSDSQ